ncbi:helix-turn-helix domain-containing protein [Myxococcota bacterium]
MSVEDTISAILPRRHGSRDEATPVHEQPARPQRSTTGPWSNADQAVTDHTMVALVHKAVTGALDKLTESLVKMLRAEIQKALTGNDRLDLVDQGWVSPKRAARLASVSYDTVLTWISEGKLRASRVGRQFRIRRDDLEVFMSQPLRSDRICTCEIDGEATRILRRRR